jgi:hypothetical protein
LDVWAALEVRNKLRSTPNILSRINEKCFVGMHAVKNDTKFPVAAYGYLCESGTPIRLHQDKEKFFLNSIAFAVKMVVKIVEPGMFLDYYEGLDLSNFGDAPFVALIDKFNLFTACEMRQSSSAPAVASDTASSSTTNDAALSSTSDNASNASSSTSTSPPLPSPVLKDVLHLMDMIKVRLSHGTAKDFARRFRDTLFVIDPIDRENVTRYLAAKGSDWNTCMVTNPDFILKSVERHIPPAKELLPKVQVLFDNYSPSRCVKTGFKLFDEEAVEMSKQVLKQIELGHVSDAEGGRLLYTELGLDKDGLMMHSCCRGMFRTPEFIKFQFIKYISF